MDVDMVPARPDAPDGSAAAPREEEAGQVERNAGASDMDVPVLPAADPQPTEAAPPAPATLLPPPAPPAAPAVYEPAPSGRSKKKGRTAASARVPEEMVRLGEQVERGSERLRRGQRPVRLSAEDKAAEITLDAEQLGARSSKGYRLVRATHGAHQGSWFFEVRVESLGATGAVRLGWATRSAEAQAPVGCDVHGYSVRSVDGAKVHAGLRQPYGRGFGEGDVVGCMLHLPAGRPLEKTADDVVKYKGRLYFTEDDEAAAAAQPVAGGFVAFWVNGEAQGAAFSEVLEGTYYPALSLYTHAHQAELAAVTVNFGEQPFAFPLPEGDAWPHRRPASELPTQCPPAN